MERPNILLITLDQFRGDCLSAAGHPVVRTPNLDRLAASGARLARHYSQATPCSPGRACLYTGTYQLNNRVVSNGTPLDDRFDNVARAARRAGYAPALWGYTDQGIDPQGVEQQRRPLDLLRAELARGGQALDGEDAAAEPDAADRIEHREIDEHDEDRGARQPGGRHGCAAILIADAVDHQQQADGDQAYHRSLDHVQHQPPSRTEVIERLMMGRMGLRL